MENNKTLVICLMLILVLYLLNYNIKENFGCAKRRIFGYEGLKSGISPPWAVDKKELDNSYVLGRKILKGLEKKLGKAEGDLVLGKVDYMTSEELCDGVRYVMDVFVHDRSIKADTNVTRRMMMNFTRYEDGRIQINHINTSNAMSGKLSSSPYGENIALPSVDELILKDEIILEGPGSSDDMVGGVENTPLEYEEYKGSVKKETPLPDMHRGWILPLGTEEQHWNRLQTKCVNTPFSPEPTMSLIDDNEYSWLFNKARGNVGAPHS